MSGDGRFLSGLVFNPFEVLMHESAVWQCALLAHALQFAVLDPVTSIQVVEE
jgi:hypothetical protein